ncbi:MAG TPA: hypothetical protein PK948_08370 [Gemmatimonadales bacterium]|nr:hypothetical protein [Gemmatimonadales bacterium]
MRARPLIPLALLLSACGSDPTPFEFSDGTLAYRAVTTTGLPLLEGRLTLRYLTDSTVEGTWTIRWSPGADPTLPVGPQVGAGTLTGTRSGSTLVLELNPEAADNNVGLVGEAVAGSLRGRWIWTTFTGPRATGRFTAAPD